MVGGGGGGICNLYGPFFKESDLPGTYLYSKGLEYISNMSNEIIGYLYVDSVVKVYIL